MDVHLGRVEREVAPSHGDVHRDPLRRKHRQQGAEEQDGGDMTVQHSVLSSEEIDRARWVPEGEEKVQAGSYIGN
jgi:hypothetical protein